MVIDKVLHKDLSFNIYGILFDVHNEIGMYGSEVQVCDLIEAKLKLKKIPYRREYVLTPASNGEKTGHHRVDFLIDNKIILEIKCKRLLTREDYYQLKRYLRTTNMALGILVNFREERLHPKRILNSLGKA